MQSVLPPIPLEWKHVPTIPSVCTAVLGHFPIWNGEYIGPTFIKIPSSYQNAWFLISRQHNVQLI